MHSISGLLIQVYQSANDADERSVLDVANLRFWYRISELINVKVFVVHILQIKGWKNKVNLIFFVSHHLLDRNNCSINDNFENFCHIHDIFWIFLLHWCSNVSFERFVVLRRKVCPSQGSNNSAPKYAWQKSHNALNFWRWRFRTNYLISKDTSLIIPQFTKLWSIKCTQVEWSYWTSQNIPVEKLLSLMPWLTR